MDTDNDATFDQLMSITGEIRPDQVPDMAEISCGFFAMGKKMHVYLKNTATGADFVLPAEAVFQLAQHFSVISSQGTHRAETRWYH
jgi:hypothetical protein